MTQIKSLRQLFNFLKPRILVLVGLVLGGLFSLSTEVRAVPCDSPFGFNCIGGCTSINECVLVGTSGRLCAVDSSLFMTVSPSGNNCETSAGSVVIGPIRPPKGVSFYNTITQSVAGEQKIGILLFISNVLKFFAVICGLLVFFNILYAGYEYITGAGKTDVHVKVRERLTWSLIGLILLIAAYMIAALIGLFIFGDPTFLLNPDLTKYGALAP